MRFPLRGGAAAILLLAWPGIGAGQSADLTRHSFAFIDTELTIDVLGEAPGVLHVTRGQIGRLDVAARAAGGLTAVGLAGVQSDNLMLSAVSADQVAYVVIVPPTVRVRVRLPDRHLAEVFGTLQDAATYRWGLAEVAGADAAALPLPSARGLPGGVRAGEAAAAAAHELFPPGGLHLAYVEARPPSRVAVQQLEALHSLTVRWEGARFRVLTSRPLSLTPGDPDRIVIRPSTPPMELVVVVPRDARQFVLEIGGQPALLLAARRASVLCTPVIEQELSGGRRWFTFTPDRGRLRCNGAPGG